MVNICNQSPSSQAWGLVYKEGSVEFSVDKLIL